MRKIKIGGWRLIAGGFAALGIAAPLVAATSLSVTPRAALIWSSFGLLCLIVTFVIFEWFERAGLLDRIASWEPAVQQMRGASLRLDQVQRRFADLDTNTNDIRALKHLLNEERHNLSLIASGMVEIRGIIDTERANLGALASATHDVKMNFAQLAEQTDRVFAEVSEFTEIAQALRSHLDALSSNIAALEEHTVTEQRNLGLVASGLDVVRRSSTGVERFEARQAAFEDVLVSISDQIDALRTSSPPLCDTAA